MRKRANAGNLLPAALRFQMTSSGEGTLFRCKDAGTTYPPLLLLICICLLLTPVPFLWGRWLIIGGAMLFALRLGIELVRTIRLSPFEGRDEEFLLLFLARVTEGTIRR